jgi:hypothetical protein
MITVRNVSDESIILDKITVAPNIYGIAYGNDTHAIAEIIHHREDEGSQSSRRVFIVLKPLQELEFGLITSTNLRRHRPTNGWLLGFHGERHGIGALRA